MDILKYIRDVLFAIKSEALKHRVLVVLVFAVILGVVSATALIWPKYYVSDATIVKDVTNVIEPLLRGAAEVTDLDKNEKVKDIIYSRRIMEIVVNQLKSDAFLSPEQIELQINQIRSNLTVQSYGRNSELTHLSFRDKTPDRAHEVMTIVVDVFISDRIRYKQEKSLEAFDFISEQAENYRKRLEVAEQKLKDFKASSVDMTEDRVTARIVSLSSEAESLRISMGETKEKINSTTEQILSESESVNLRTRLNSYESRRALLEDKLAQLRLTYQDSYPDVISVQSQIDEVDSEIRAIHKELPLGAGASSELPLLEELRKQLSSSEVEYKVQQRRLKALEQLLDKEKQLADEVANNQAQLLNLTRDYNVTKNLYETMLSRKENAKLTLALNDEGQGESYRLSDPPTFPLKPSGVRALYIFLAAPFFAVAVPLGLLTSFVLFDPRIRSSTLLVSKLPSGVALLGNIPHRGTPLASKLLRKDIFVLAVFILALILGYLFILFKYLERL